MIEKAETAYQLQIKAQRTAEEAISHLRAYMKEQENTVLKEKCSSLRNFVSLSRNQIW